ncbi:MAG: hypothetical protein ICV87_06760, partial [Gemmatimonadetes bacterium]|nr:hypothetical protein [Gemmatimonadota bacterium]
LLRRSVVYFADRLDAVLRAQGRDSSGWQYHRYQDAGHGIRHLRGYRRRVEAFLRRVSERGAPPSTTAPTRTR